MPPASTQVQSSTGPNFTEVIESIVSEKGFNKEILHNIVEEALTTVVQAQYGKSSQLFVKLGKSGNLSFFKSLEIVPDDQDRISDNEITLSEAKKETPESEIGKNFPLPIEGINLNYSALNNARRLIASEIQKREKEMEFHALQKIEGEIITGIVKKAYPNGLLVTINRFEAYIAKQDLLPLEFGTLVPGSKINALLYSVRRDDTRPQACLTRTSETFLVKLLSQEIQEIEDGEIEIKSLARDPGSRSKVAVATKNPALDPISVCIGLRGRKISSIMKELNGEKIDIIKWSEDPAEFLVSALRNVKISNIIVDLENKSLDIIISAEDISLSIGRRGQNARLLSKMMGWAVHFLTDEENSKKKLDDFESKTSNLMEQLNLEEIIAQLLVVENLDTVSKISSASTGDLLKIEGFDEEIAEAIQLRAEEIQKAKDAELEKSKLQVAKIAKDIAQSLGVNHESALILTSKEVDTIQKIADLSIDEVREDLHIPEEEIPTETLSDIIMKARSQIYGI